MSETVNLEKPLPSSDESERVILGGILLDNDVIVNAIEKVKPEDFYSPFHRRVYAAMISLFNQQKVIDPILIGEELKKEGSLETIGGISTITNLTFGLPHFTNISEYLQVVRDKASLRNLVRTCNAITQDALSESDTASNILERAESAMYHLIDNDMTAVSTQMSVEVAEAMEAAKLRAESGSILVGVSTGFTDLDLKLQGFREGQYVPVGARPSMGKTSFAVRSLYKAALAGNPVFLFSLEMSKEEIAERIICAETNIDTLLFRTGHLTKEQWVAVEGVRRNLTEAAGFFINDTPSVSTQFIRAEMRRANMMLRKQGKKLKLVCIDHIGLMSNEVDVRGRSRENEVSTISKTLKAIAREYQCTVMPLSQFNRQPENRADHRPNVSDFRESGSIEQDADVALLLYREDYYQTDPTLHNNIAEVIIGKNRNGPTGTVKLSFTRKSTKFADLSEISEPVQQFGDFDL